MENQNPDGPILASHYNNTTGSSLINQSGNNAQDNTFPKNGDIIISPNPTTGLINLTSNLEIENASVEIYNVLGKNLIRMNEKNVMKNISYQYDISKLPSGIYMITVRTGNKIIHSSKIIRL